MIEDKNYCGFLIRVLKFEEMTANIKFEIINTGIRYMESSGQKSWS